jgi:hypothetical protein
MLRFPRCPSGMTGRRSIPFMCVRSRPTAFERGERGSFLSLFSPSAHVFQESLKLDRGGEALLLLGRLSEQGLVKLFVRLGVFELEGLLLGWHWNFLVQAAAHRGVDAVRKLCEPLMPPLRQFWKPV